MREKVKNNFEEYIDGNQHYYIYGTTNFGMFCFDKIADRFGNNAVEGFVETFPRSSVFCEKPVISPEEIKITNEKIIIASFTYHEEMCAKLKECGIDDSQIIYPEAVRPLFRTLREKTENSIKSICIWPPVAERDMDLEKKLKWFVPDRITVYLWSENRTSDCWNDNVKVFSISEKKPIYAFEETDYIYLRHVDKLSDIPERYLDKVHVIDKDFYMSIETFNWDKLYFYSFSEYEQNKYEAGSGRIYADMIKNNLGRRANIFCSGPSIKEIESDKYANDFNIICNSIVKDKKFMELVNPDFLTFTDVNFFMSPSDYGMAFYKDVAEAFELYHFNIGVLDYMVPLILRHYPQFSGYITGFHSVTGMKGYNFPDGSNMNVKNTSNIMTLLMLPVASAISNVIGIAGCTGRKDGETYYWEHNDRVQYLDLMQSVFDMYPSIFKYQKYGDYYKRHCSIVEGMIEYGCSLGKEYVCLTTSFIPALERLK